MTNILEVNAIHTFIGQFHILEGVSLSVPQGSITALLGRNGAGKTTTLRSIMGLNPPREGTFLYAGEPIQGKAAYQIAARGIGYVPEYRAIFRAFDRRGEPQNRRAGAKAIWRGAAISFSSFSPISNVSIACLAASFPAASSRCSRLRARWCPKTGCCWWMSRAKGWRPSSSRPSSPRCGACRARHRAAGGAELPHGLAARRPLLHPGRWPNGQRRARWPIWSRIGR